MTLQEFRHLLNTLPLAADNKELVIRDMDTHQVFEVEGVEVKSGVPAIQIALK